MYKKIFEVSENPRITVEDCVGNLNIKSGEAGIVTVVMPEEEDTLIFDQDGNVVNLTIKDNGRIVCPANSTIHLVKTRGNLKVRDIEGDLTIGTVSGNTDLRGIGNVKMETGRGSLRLKSSSGTVEIDEISGSARVQNVDGVFKLGLLGSSLRAGGLQGGLSVEAVGADARLEPPYTPGSTYHLTVGSDLVIHLPVEPNVCFNLIAGGQVISRIPSLELNKGNGTVTGTLGEGEAELSATVGGSVVLRSHSDSEADAGEDFDFDFNFEFDPGTFAFLEELGPLIENSVSKAMAKVDEQLEEGLKYFNSEEFKAKMDRVAEKAKRAAERIEQQAEGVAERARRDAERAAERARMRAQQAERRWQRASGQRTPSPPTPTSEPTKPDVEDKREERLNILRLVEQGTISADEAAKLLTALK